MLAKHYFMMQSRHTSAFRSYINLVIVSVSCPQFGLPIAVILIWPRWYTLSNAWLGRLFMEKRNPFSIHYLLKVVP